MRYQIWGEYLPGSGYAFAENLEGLTDEQIIRIIRGERIKGGLPTVTATELTRGKRPDSLATPSSVRLVADNIKTLLESFCPKEIQFLPAVVLRYPKTKYQLVNALAKIACFDRERSDFGTLRDRPDVVIHIERLVLKPIPEDTLALVHVAELPWIWLIRDDLREKILSGSSSPGTFTMIEDFRR